MKVDVSLLNLDDPKNTVQFSLYKTQLAFEQLCSTLVPVLTATANRVVNAFTPVMNAVLKYQSALDRGAEKNPRIAYLAYHGKTERIRAKNLKRLYKLGKEDV